MIPFELRPRVENLEELVAILFSQGGESFGRGSAFVFRPGGVAGGNVFTTWPSLYAAYSLVQGQRWVFVDDILAAAHVPAGAWNIDQTTFVGNFNSETEVLHFDQGATVTFDNIWIDGGLVFQNNSTNPVFTFANGQNFAFVDILFGNIQSATAAPWGLSTNTTPSTELLVNLWGTSALGDQTHPAFSSTSAVISNLAINIFDDATIFPHALGGTGRILVSPGPGAVIKSPQDVVTIDYVNPYLNLAEGFNSGGAIGPSATATQATGNITRIRGGKVRVVGAISGVTSVAATVTVTLLRDAVVIGQAVVSTQADDLTYAATLQAIDTLPDSLAHTYSIQAASSAGTTTVATNQARIDADEL